MRTLLKRNIKIYFKDWMNMFFSLLSILVIIVLYIVFLGNNWRDVLMADLVDADVLLYSWLAAGIVAVATITTTLGAFSVIIDDRIKKIEKGFYASPVKRKSIVSAYLLSAFVVGMIMSTITFVLFSLYILFIGGDLLSPVCYLQILGVLVVSNLSGTAMVCFIASFIRSSGAFTSISTILGTLVGFLAGIYFPIGVLPESVQMVIRLFPPSYSGMLLRRILMENPIVNSFYGIPTQYVEEFRETMGVVYKFGDFEVTPIISVMILLGTAIIFFGLSLLNMRKMKK